jgi:predicted Ser/Thr protein kinase
MANTSASGTGAPEPRDTGAETIGVDEATRISRDSRMAARFIFKKSLGVGGMGEVYLAEDSALRRLVAIKTIRPDLCKEPEVRKRIERECLLHAKVGAHPHIVTLYDKLEDGEHINLVMEYVEGETLQQMLERHAKAGTTPALGEAIAIATQSLEALGRIHAHGIVHRDIKPSNIILSRDDCGDVCAKLMDFGIARAQDDEFASRLTQQFGSGPGTPLYMAPEQIDPETFGDITPATDVYAMGIMLYQMTSGEPPFNGTLTQIFSGHLHGSPPRLSERAKGRVPDALVDIVHCALAKRPEQRFPSAKAFRDELLAVSTAAPSVVQTRVNAGSAVDPAKTAVFTGTNPGSTLVGGAAAAAPGSTMLSGAAVTGTEVRRRRKWVRLIGTAAAVAVLGAGAALAYRSLGGEKSEPAEPQATPASTADASTDAPAAPATPAAVVPAAAAPDTPAVPAPAPTALSAPDVTTVPAATSPPVMDAPAVPLPEPSVLPPPSGLAAPASSGSALAAFEEAYKEKQDEPVAAASVVPDAVPDAAPPDSAPDPPAAAPEPPKKPKTTPAKAPSKPKAKPAPAPTHFAEPAEKAKPAAPKEPEPAADSGGSGGWTVKSETTYKK